MLVMRPCTSTRIQGNRPSLVRTEYSVYWTDVAWLGMTNPSSTNSRAGCRPQRGTKEKRRSQDGGRLIRLVKRSSE